MSALPSCCDHYGVDCAQGRRCPARNSVCAITTFYAEVEGVLPMIDDCHKPSPARVPFPVLDGAEPVESTAFDPEEFSWLDPGEWCGIGLLAVICLATWIGGPIAAWRWLQPAILP